MNNETMHIYGQQQWHDEALIVANREALLALRDAIDDALASGQGVAETFASDNEGYQTYVVLKDGKCGDPDWLQLMFPYTYDYAQDKREDFISPFSLVKYQRPAE